MFGRKFNAVITEYIFNWEYNSVLLFNWIRAVFTSKRTIVVKMQIMWGWTVNDNLIWIFSFPIEFRLNIDSAMKNTNYWIFHYQNQERHRIHMPSNKLLYISCLYMCVRARMCVFYVLLMNMMSICSDYEIPCSNFAMLIELI